MYEIHFVMDTPGGEAWFGRVMSEPVFSDWNEAQRRVNYLNQDNTANGHDGRYQLVQIPTGKGEQPNAETGTDREEKI